MTFPYRMQIPLADTTYQKILTRHKGFIVLTENDLHYRAKFLANETEDDEDKTYEWKEVFNDSSMLIRRISITRIEVSLTSSDKWILKLNFLGGSEDGLYWYYRSEASARETMAVLRQWAFGVKTDDISEL